MVKMMVTETSVVILYILVMKVTWVASFSKSDIHNVIFFPFRSLVFFSCRTYIIFCFYLFNA